MSNKEIEIELKFPLENCRECIRYLNANARLVAKGVEQKDIYYNSPHRDFLSVDYPFEWLRLRESAKGYSLDYKHFYPENVEKTDYCDEFQTVIENVETFKKILNSLNFKEIIVVKKFRDIWIYKGAEIVIDVVDNLGTFIELEAIDNFKDPKDGKKYLYELLKEISAETGEEDLRGYPFRMLEKQGYKFKK